MDNLKEISLEDSGLIVTYKSTVMYKMIKASHIDNLYDLVNNYESVYNLFCTNLHDDDKKEFLSLIDIIKYKYLNEELTWNLDEDFTDCISKRSWTNIQRKLQKYGIVKQLAWSYAAYIYCNNIYETKVIDVIENILINNPLRDNGNYNNTLYEVAKNRALILHDYYNNKENIKNSKLNKKLEIISKI